MQETRRLWLDEKDTTKSSSSETREYETFESIALRHSFVPTPQPISVLLWNSMFVGQEFILSCLLPAAHRVLWDENKTVKTFGNKNDWNSVANRIFPSLVLIWLAFLLVVLHNQPNSKQTPSRRQKAQTRLLDALFMVVVLRFLAPVLQTLTASYSSDTVQTLAFACMALHFMACDFTYARGYIKLETSIIPSEEASKRGTVPPRSAFQGGTLSLTAAFLATILWASRLASPSLVYIFVCFSMVLFALFPAARHQVTVNTRRQRTWVSPVITCFLTLAATSLLESPIEVCLIIASLVILCVIVPLWKYVLQKSKVSLRGPWDIAQCR